MRADLLRGETQLWLYYDAPGATSEASLADTFVRGVIDDIAFEGTSWSAVHDESVVAPSQTNEWSVIASGGQVTTYLARPPSTNGSMAAICTMMTFPHGRTYALDVEVDIVLADGAGATIRIDDLAVWNGGALGRRTATTTEDVPILPGYHHVCLGVAASDSSVGQGVDARFALPRVRRRAGRYDAFEPIGRVRFDREETCP